MVKNLTRSVLAAVALCAAGDVALSTSAMIAGRIGRLGGALRGAATTTRAAHLTAPAASDERADPSRATPGAGGAAAADSTGAEGRRGGGGRSSIEGGYPTDIGWGAGALKVGAGMMRWGYYCGTSAVHVVMRVSVAIYWIGLLCVAMTTCACPPHGFRRARPRELVQQRGRQFVQPPPPRRRAIAPCRARRRRTPSR